MTISHQPPYHGTSDRTRGSGNDNTAQSKWRTHHRRHPSAPPM